MFVSFTEIWFSQSSAEIQRMKFLVWLRRKCVEAGYKNTRVLGRSVIAKPAEASDYVIMTECPDQADYFRLLDVISELTSGMQQRFIAAGGIKWGESIFLDLVDGRPQSKTNGDANGEHVKEVEV